MNSVRDDQDRGYVNLSPRLGRTEKTWEVFDLTVQLEHRGKGVGRSLLMAVCKQADDEGVTLELIVGSGGFLDDTQLKEWYGRYGFVLCNKTYWMRRRPLEKTTAAGGYTLSNDTQWQSEEARP